MASIAELKKTLKSWELAFYKKNNTKPSKNDIDQAPQEIKDAYRDYAFQRKSSDANRVKDKSENTVSGEVTVQDQDVDHKKEITDLNKSENDGDNEQGSKTNSDADDVWGSNLNKAITETEEIVKEAKRKSSFGFLDKLGDKLFQNSKKLPTSGKKQFLDKSWRKNSIEESQQKEKSVISDDCFDEGPTTAFRDVGNNIGHSEEPMDEVDGDINLNCGKVIEPSKGIKPKFSGSMFSAPPKFAKKKVNAVPTDNVEVPCHLKLSARKKFSVSNFSPKEIRNPFPEDSDFNETNIENFSVQLPRAKGNVMEVDESMFEQEFAENADVSLHGSSISTNKPTPMKQSTRFSGTKNSSFLESYGDTIIDPTPLEVKTAPRKRLNDEYIPADLSDPGNHSDEEQTVKKKTRKRKQSVDQTSRKKVKVNSGEAYPVGEESSTYNDDDVVTKVKPKTVPRRPTASKSNDNFVRLNMKVKKYRRKDGKHMTGGQWKRKQWKQKMQARSKSYGDKCFICNETGHWSRNCPQKNGGSKKVVEDIDESDFPSIQEAANMARGVQPGSQKPTPAQQASTTVSDATDQQVPDSMLDVEMSIVRSRREQILPPESVEPLLELQPDGELADTTSVSEIKAGLKKFGFSQFRPGQEETVKRILTGLSTLVVLSTGGGKSLCYQLPAYIYAQRSKCITIVVSPLVSLMEDQVTGLPPGVRGACLHANMTKAQRDGVLAAVNDGNVHFLLVSPEAVVGGGGGLQGSFPAPDKLPPIPFVCIDEAHCLSEWSHNFRPSYLRLCKVLRERYGVKCFLGLTATATKSTALDVARHLGIEDVEKATIRGSPVPKNLILSVSQDENRDEALVSLLNGERFKACHSIIIYCTRRELTNRVSTLLRTCFKEEVDLTQPGEKPKGKGKKKFAIAESYHAGLTPAQRKRVQKNFMSGQLRIVVATVAFGMGLDKPDVRAVIHYNMPKSFEGYVQEIGRAGRDGNISHCHLFLDPEGKDLSELKRHTYGNTVDRISIKKLMRRVFRKCRCREIHESRQNTEPEDKPSNETVSQRVCPGHERALPIDKTVMDLDIREEGIATLLCYLELHPECWLENLQPVYATCKLICYGGPAQLQAVAKKCPPVAVAIARQKMDGQCFAQANSLEFPIVDISDTMGWDSGPVKREVKLLQWNMSTLGGQFTSKSGVLVEFSDLAFHLRCPGDLLEDEMDSLVDLLHSRVTRQEATELFQLNLLYNSLKSAAHKSYWMCADQPDIKKSDRLRQLMENFFHEEKSAQTRAEEEEAQEAEVNQIPTGPDLQQLIFDIRQLVTVYGEEHSLNGRAIARIFHGIGSPCFPIDTWCRVRRFWRSHLHINFNVVLKTATRELIRMR